MSVKWYVLASLCITNMMIAHDVVIVNLCPDEEFQFFHMGADSYEHTLSKRTYVGKIHDVIGFDQVEYVKNIDFEKKEDIWIKGKSWRVFPKKGHYHRFNLHEKRKSNYIIFLLGATAGRFYGGTLNYEVYAVNFRIEDWYERFCHVHKVILPFTKTVNGSVFDQNRLQLCKDFLEQLKVLGRFRSYYAEYEKKLRKLVRRYGYLDGAQETKNCSEKDKLIDELSHEKEVKEKDLQLVDCSNCKDSFDSLLPSLKRLGIIKDDVCLDKVEPEGHGKKKQVVDQAPLPYVPYTRSLGRDTRKMDKKEVEVEQKRDRIISQDQVFDWLKSDGFSSLYNDCKEDPVENYVKRDRIVSDMPQLHCKPKMQEKKQRLDLSCKSIDLEVIESSEDIDEREEKIEEKPLWVTDSDEEEVDEVIKNIEEQPLWASDSDQEIEDFLGNRKHAAITQVILKNKIGQRQVQKKYSEQKSEAEKSGMPIEHFIKNKLAVYPQSVASMYDLDAICEALVLVTGMLNVATRESQEKTYLETLRCTLARSKTIKERKALEKK